MPLRVKLILAFLLLSVVPLGAVTMYSYVANRNALRTAAAREADQLAGELSQRMQLVTAQLSERVEQLVDLQTAAEPVVRTSQKVETKAAKAQAAAESTASAESTATAEKKNTIDVQVADALGEAAMLLNAVELQGMRGFGRSGPRPPDDRRGGPLDPAQGRPSRLGPPGAPNAPTPAGAPPPPPASAAAPTTPAISATVPSAASGNVAAGGATVGGPVSAAPSPGPGDGRDPQRGRRFRSPPPQGAMPPFFPGARGGQTGPDGSGGPRFPPPPGAPPGATPPPGTAVSPEDSDKIKIDLGPIRRDLFRQIIPEGTSPNDMTPEQRQRLATEVNQRMLGIVEGIKLGAAELQKKAEAAKRKAEADAAISRAATKATSKAEATPEPLKRKAAISGNKLGVTLEQNGKVVRAVNAEINLPQVLMTVFSSMTRGQGEVPFAVGGDGRVYTPSDADRVVVENLKPTSLPNGTSNVEDWIVVTTNDPTGSGLRLGIARPVGDSLSELRRTAGRNAALGLLLIGVAIVGVVPLSGRLTRNLSTLTDGVQRIAHGDFGARVSVKSRDEVGHLAKAFNQMAADVEAHQRTLLEQERLKRELELGRQIQNDMLPHAPLKLGLTQVAGVSAPAREVGGDFFNYFALPNGHVALLVGDVSGKGVGAALLMANIQASLRTRIGLGQDLPDIADAIDRDIDLNSPGQMYATMFLGILDPQTRTLQYINAGHHPQFVLRQNRGMERMGATGLPIGLLAGRGYVAKTLTLEAGDLIVFYTDGVVETENSADEMFGSDRFEQLVLACAGRSAEELLHAVDKELKTFRGSREPYDDATLMAVRVG